MARRLFGGSAEVDGTELVNPLNVPDPLDRALADIPRPIPVPGNLLLAARTLCRPDRHTV